MFGVTLMATFFLGILTLGSIILFLTFRQWLRLRIDKKKQTKTDIALQNQV